MTNPSAVEVGLAEVLALVAKWRSRQFMLANDAGEAEGLGTVGIDAFARLSAKSVEAGRCADELDALLPALREALADGDALRGLLRDIRNCGEWYPTALEIDTYAGHGHDGTNLPARIDAILAGRGGGEHG